MATYRFTPPTEDTVSNVAYDVPPLSNRLMRYFPQRKRGIAIWHLEDDTLSFDQPIPTILDDAQNATTLWPLTVADTPPGTLPSYPIGGGDSNLKNLTYKFVYLGGHVYTITDATEVTNLTNFLTAQGYTPSDWLVAI